MRRLIMFNSVGLDRYFADAQGGLEWDRRVLSSHHACCLGCRPSLFAADDGIDLRLLSARELGDGQVLLVHGPESYRPAGASREVP
jgi:hypothetical protein